MKRKLAMLALLAAVAAMPARSNAMELVTTDTGTVNLEGYIQWLGEYQNVQDDRKGFEDRSYLFMKEARLQADGNYGDVKYNFMLAPGPEDAAETQGGSTANSALGLQDFSFDIPAPGLENTSVKVGQFLVPYGRERLTDDRTISFGDRSVEDLGFTWNRDVGAALQTYQGRFAGTMAVMTGAGRDIPLRYLPEKLGFPLTVVRVGYNDGVDKDIYAVSARDDNPASGYLHRDNGHPNGTETAAYLNGLYMRDSDVGHSTVLNVRASDQNLLIDPKYNPFIGMSAAGPQSYSLANIYMVGADGVFRAPLGSARFNSEAQVDYGHFDNEFGSLNIKGGRVQAGVSKGKWEANVRYSALFLDEHMANVVAGTPASYAINQHTGLITLNPAVPGASYAIVDNKRPIQEVTPSLTYHYRPNVSIVGDLPMLLDMPVFQDPTSGNYVMSEQQDQVTYDKGGDTIARRNVYEARLMIQVSF